jgi:hypothetical protein
MNRNELERAWPATEPSAGFAERVLERARRAPEPPVETPRRAGLSGWLTARRARWLALPAVALSLGLAAALVIGPARSARDGDVIAAEPRFVTLGERAVAEMSSGAHIRWSADAAEREVWQDAGEVAYRVVPGADFRVQTPYGSIAVLGTVFRVVVSDGNAAAEGGELMKKGWAIAGAGATLGAFVLVSVEQGSVRLSKGKEELVLGPGQAGALGSDGVPRRATEEPAPPPERQLTAEADAERARARRVADAVRRNAARRREAQAAKSGAAAKRPGAAPPSQEAQAAPAASESTSALKPQGERRREYIQRTMREQYYPVARDCYEELLGRDPKARGKVVLEFAIVGDGDAGVVDRVATRDDENTIDDPEFVMCMRESLYTAVFEPPPPGANETTVVYPVMLEPGE